MSTIRILPEKIASQIAAGEVVTRPSSVVRELMDNSIDAKSDRIDITIKRGGIDLIKVTDNGTGMTRDDILLCIERHATSKIETTEDLFHVNTLGFRGEAIPSIASVSKMKIISRTRDDMVGHTLTIEGETLKSIDETSSPAGTAIEVKNLFYNVPARRKFLRTPQTETNHVQDIEIKTALPFTHIHFTLKQGEKILTRLPATGNILHRLSSLMGRQVAEKMLQHTNETPDLAIDVCLGLPEFARKRGDRLFVYVNNRNIRDRFVTRAVIEGYGQRLMKGQYPQAVVFITIDPSKIDVNVHPAKEEIRFHDSFKVFRAIVSTVESALKSINHTYAGIGSTSTFIGNTGSHYISEPPAMEFEDDQEWIFSDTDEKDTDISPKKDLPAVIGQLGNSYIICETERGLMLIDQHAAHERLVYETLKETIAVSPMASQRLITPIQIELSAKESTIALENAQRLAELGIELEHFGGNTFLLRSYPAVLDTVNWNSLIPELLLELKKDTRVREILFDKILSIMACHSAIRAKHKMAREEMTDLVRRLGMANLPTNCPHGRPVFKEITYTELEKMFKRIP